MKITDLTITPVAFPDPPLRNAVGVHEPYALRHLVQVHTDEGRVGLGETHGGESLGRKLQAARARLLGHDPLRTEALRLLFRDPLVCCPLEMACLDLAGQQLGLSVCQLLGGPLRREVEFSAYLFFRYEDDRDDWGRVMEPQALLEEAQRFHDTWGFRCHKLKGGVLPPERELEALRLLREHFGETHQLRLDPNGAWSVQTAHQAGPALAELRLEYLEDPCTGMAALAEVRDRIPVPLSTNSCVVRWDHFPDAVDLGPVDVVLSDPHVWGGLVATKLLGHVCQVFGYGVGMHSNTHLGVSLAAMVQVAAATPQMTYACDTHYPWLEEDVLLGGKWKFREGRLLVPSGPGLGVELDPDQVQRFHENYLRVGLKERDDQAQIRRYEPDWVLKIPRW